MKLIDALNIEQEGRFEIPDADRNDLPGFFKEMGYKVGVEIGVFKGDYSTQFLERGLKLYSVDPWLGYEDYGRRVRNFQSRQDENFQETSKKLSTYPNSVIIRKTSMEAVKDFEDESIDFVYIDGHHGFKYVAEDLWEWSKKVKKGGCISGHDYGVLSRKKPMLDRYNNHVKYVVDAFTAAVPIKKWYVIGAKHKVEGEKRDNWRSFFWIKS
jgi:SAM-dependent methyltransferase